MSFGDTYLDSKIIFKRSHHHKSQYRVTSGEQEEVGIMKGHVGEVLLDTENILFLDLSGGCMYMYNSLRYKFMF